MATYRDLALKNTAVRKYVLGSIKRSFNVATGGSNGVHA